MSKELDVPLLLNKDYRSPSVFLPENLLREARRQKSIPDCPVPEVCVLDPDGDLADYLMKCGKASLVECWACYHSKMYRFNLDAIIVGIVPCIVGASYAVLVAEQLFVSGCKYLISITSAGIINNTQSNNRFALITEAFRDEGTSYHYLPPAAKTKLSQSLRTKLIKTSPREKCPYFEAKSWTTDAPYRETEFAIEGMKRRGAICVEMEAAALYALAEAKQYDIICFAHLTNSMAQATGDFEKGEEFGSLDTLELVKYTLNSL